MSEPSKKTGLIHENARTEEQKKLMAQIEQDGVCPFCAEHFKKYHPKPIIKETDSWFLTTNMSPYEGTTYHFLFVYKKAHVISPSEITPESRADLFDLINWTVEKYDIKGGSFFMRFGDHHYTGGSVEHLHTHLIVGDTDESSQDAIRVKLGWKVAS
ncbi:HIT domain-containing protein [Candidatus Kaiserbacteria bacterium]|nr:HIT domain-containing protein [Candidatus Kaiserbacteria bacterium]